MTSSLPPEIWADIVANLRDSLRDLLTLTLVSEPLKSEAERVLFHDITITRPEDGASSNTRARLLTRILAPGPIASYIHTLQLNLIGFNPKNPDSDHQYLLAALRKMSNLRDMRLSESYDSSHSILAELAGSVPFRLERLETSTDLCDGLDDFLRTQPSIRTFKWPGKLRRPTTKAPREPEATFPSPELPNLRTLALGYSDHLPKFLPRCCVSHLQLENLELHKQMAVMPSVLSLQINFLSTTSQSPFVLLAAKFPSVQFLDIIWTGLPEANVFKPFSSLVKLSLWDDDRPVERDWDKAVNRWSEFTGKILEGPSTMVMWIDITYRSMVGSNEKLLRVRRSAKTSAIVAETVLVDFEELDKDWEHWNGIREW